VYTGCFSGGARHGRGVQSYRAPEGCGKTGLLMRQGALGVVCEGNWVGGQLSSLGGLVTVVEDTFPSRVTKVMSRFSNPDAYLPYSLPHRCLSMFKQWQLLRRDHGAALKRRLVELNGGTTALRMT
jgi:hypothetical protein